VLVEWGEKFPSVVKRSQGEIVMTSLDGDARRIVLKMKPVSAVVAGSKTP
jgi:tRNA threonylcarbamoyladenosine biosynthesis protein TsaE